MKTLFLDDEQCGLLREMLDFVPLNPRYLPLVVDLLQRIPEPEARGPRPGSTPAAPVRSQEAAGGFQLFAFTPKRKAALADVARRLPHGDGI